VKRKEWDIPYQKRAGGRMREEERKGEEATSS
jgi:hypothetical protein